MRSTGGVELYHQRPDVPEPFSADGYYITGDVFRRNEQGFYWFVGRHDDMFVCGGENIWPGEVEKLLERHPQVNGPMYKVPTRLLDNGASSVEIEKQVSLWFDIPLTGGTVMAEDGTFYFSDLAENSIKRRHPDGKIDTLIKDDRLHWVDAPVVEKNTLWLPVPQMDRVPLFQQGHNKTEWPVRIYKLELTR